MLVKFYRGRIERLDSRKPVELTVHLVHGVFFEGLALYMRMSGDIVTSLTSIEAWIYRELNLDKMRAEFIARVN